MFGYREKVGWDGTDPERGTFGSKAIGGENVLGGNIPVRFRATSSPEISRMGAAPGRTGALGKEGEEAGSSRKKRRRT